MRSRKRTRRTLMTSRFDYAAYLQSEKWARKRAKALAQAGNRCALCNGSVGLNVHHRTYQRIGNESQEDLIVLCRNCHERHHAIFDEGDLMHD
jgi:5-methylcytosine-specific restriction endonuclease McrA